MLLSGVTDAEDQDPSRIRRQIVPGEFVVALTPGPYETVSQSVESLQAATDVPFESTREILTLDNQQAGTVYTLVEIKVSDQTDIEAVTSSLATADDVSWAAPNYRYTGSIKDFVPNDPDYANQYHHPLIGNDVAWDTTLGDANVIVGVTDDGVQLDHPDLAANIYVNPGEIANNGIDDDANGYIDDVSGWDFVSDDNDANPINNGDSHGTHVAGISAGVTNNGVGIAGNSGNSSILPLRIAGSDGGFTSTILAETFAYAIDNGAKIVNTSYNINGFVGDPIFTAGIQYFYDNDGLHFNSAGNANQLDPPRQAFHSTILVASTDAADRKSGFSNYGDGIDVSAPGSAILSTVTGSGFANFSGTSMAAPNAAGVAALVWSAHPTWTRNQVVAAVLATADNIDAQNPGFEGLLGAGRVNSGRAIQADSLVNAPQVQRLDGLPANGSDVSVLGTISSMTVRFDQIMEPDTINDPNNIVLTEAGPNGIHGDADDVTVGITQSTFYRTGTNEITWNINDGDLDIGRYVYTISENVTNPFGESIDGNADGTGGDAFQVFFNVVEPPFVELPPLGSQISRRDFPTAVSIPSEIRRIPVNINAGQSFTTIITPQAAAEPLEAHVQVLTPGGIVIASASAAPGEVVVIPDIRTAEEGEYTVRVRGLNGSVGEFESTTIVNAVVELESLGIGTNDTMAEAIDLAPARVDLGFGSERTSAVGTADGLNDDWYSFQTSGTGLNTISVTRHVAGAGSLNLEVYDPTGLLLAAGATGATNLDEVIQQIAGFGTGQYFARVIGDAGDYSLVVTSNADFDNEPNDDVDVAAAQDLTSMPDARATGWVSTTEADVYTFFANTGNNLVIQTATPGAGLLEPENSLDPRVELFGPSGTLISRGEGIGNEFLTHSVIDPGRYFVRVTPQLGEGTYVLSVDGRPAVKPPFAITSVTPNDGVDSANPLNEILLTFNDTVITETAMLNDITIDGQPISGVRRIDATTVALEFPILPGGNHTLTIQAGAIQDLQATPVLFFESTFSTHNGPQLVSTTLNPFDQVDGAAFSLDLVFDQELDATLDVTDTTIISSDGFSFSPTGFNYVAGTSTLTLDFTNIPEGSYDLIVASGDDAVQDLDGNDLDAEFDGVNTFGDGTPGGDLILPFFVDQLTSAFPTPLNALAPRGSLAYSTQVSGALAVPGDTDTFTMNLDADQLLSIAVIPEASLDYSVELLGPGGRSIFQATLPAGQAFTFSDSDVVPDGPGTYSLTLTGGTGTGNYVVRSLLNSVFELENLLPINNDSAATAQNIDAHFVDRGVAAGQSIASVLGEGGTDDDFYKFSVGGADAISVSVTGQTERDYRIELWNEAGTLKFAEGVSAANLDSTIERFAVPVPTLLARVINDGPVGTEYNLVVTRGAAFDSEANSDAANAQLITPQDGAFGYLSSLDITSSETAEINGPIPVLNQYAGPSWTGWRPPDPTIAAGPTTLVAGVNTDIAIYDKDSGAVLFQQDLSGAGGFFGSAGSTSTVFDPWVLYDHETDRFFFVAIENVGNRAFMLIAVSTDSTPTNGTTDWHKYRLDFTHDAAVDGLGTGNHFPDYEKVGVNSDALYISGNYFPIQTGSGVYNGITGIEKSSLLNGGPANIVYEEHFSGFSVFPLQQYGVTTTQYFAETVGGGTFRIHAIDDVLSGTATRQVTTLNVPVFGGPVNPPQLGGNANADSLGTRIMTGVYRDGSMWFAHGATDPAIGDGESVVRWYEVAANDFGTTGGSLPSLVQHGNVDPGPGVHAWMPAINVDGAGNMGIGFAVGGANQFYSAGFTGRLATDPAGSVVLPITEYATGLDNYDTTGGGGGRNRWGDYTGLAIDPTDDATFWVFNEYAGLNNRWATEIASFQLGQTIDDDWYEFAAVVGDVINIDTATPGSPSGQFPNSLNPSIELYDPAGFLIPHTNVAGNESLTYVVTTDGIHQVRLFGEATSAGEYHVSISGATGVDTGPRIIDTDPDNGAALHDFPTTYTLDFNEPILVNTIQAGDLIIGGLPATSLTQIDGDTFEFGVDPAAHIGDGIYDVHMNATAVLDLQGLGNAEYSGTFIIDTSGPRITSSTWNGQLFQPTISPGQPLSIDFQFDEALYQLGSAFKGPFAPGLDDVEITNDSTGEVIGPLDVVYDSVNFIVTATFDVLPEANYTLRLASGDIAFEDAVGNDLDGEAIGPNLDGTVTGDGTAGGDYVISFQVDLDQQLANQFIRLEPFGGLMAESTGNTGHINSATDTDVFTFFGKAGQVVSAELIQAPGTSFAPSLELFGNGGSVGAPGETINYAALPVEGLYDLRVTGAGDFDYELIISSGFVTERSAVIDSTDGNEFHLNPTIIPVVSGSASRFAVKGTAEASLLPTLGADLLGVDYGYTTSTIYDINPANGRLSNPRVLNIGNVIDVARSPIGDWYAITAFDAVNGDSSSLYSVDTTTGAATLIGALSEPIEEGDMDFHPITGELFVVNSATSTLSTVNTATGNSTVLTTVDSGIDLSAMAFDDSGALYLLDSFRDELLNYNFVTNTATSVVVLSVPIAEFAGMDFQPESGLLHIADGGAGSSRNFLTVDLSTGVATTLGTTDPSVEGLSGIEFHGGVLPAVGELFGLQVSTGEIVEIDPSTGAIVNSFPAPVGFDISAGLSGAQGGTSLIVQSNQSPGEIFRVSPVNGTILSTESVAAGASGGVRAGLTFHDDSPFTLDGTAFVERQDGFGGALSTHVSLAAPNLLGALGGDDRGRQFVVAGDEIHEFDPETPGVILNTFDAPSTSISGLAFNGQTLFAFDAAASTIVWLSPLDGSVIQTVPFAGGDLAGLGVARTNTPPTQPNVVYVARRDLGDLGGQVDVYDFDGNLLSIIDDIVLDGKTITDVELGPNRDVYVAVDNDNASGGSGSIAHFAADGTFLQLIALPTQTGTGGQEYPFGFEVLEDGRLLVPLVSEERIVLLNTDGSLATEFLVPGVAPADVTVLSDGTIVVADRNSGTADGWINVREDDQFWVGFSNLPDAELRDRNGNVNQSLTTTSIEDVQQAPDAGIFSTGYEPGQLTRFDAVGNILYSVSIPRAMGLAVASGEVFASSVGLATESLTTDVVVAMPEGNRTVQASITHYNSASSGAESFAEMDNLLVNGSFETGDFTGWTVTNAAVPLAPWAVSGTGAGGNFGLQTTTPQDGSFVAWNSFDAFTADTEFTMFQDVEVPTQPELSWQFRAQWDFGLGANANIERTFTVEAINPLDDSLLGTLYTFGTGTQAVNPTGDTGWLTETVDLSDFVGQTIRLMFRETIPEAGTGPAQIEFDNISLVSNGNGAFDIDEYTVDLTAGQGVDIVLAGHDGLDFSGELLELLDVDGQTVIATAVANPLTASADAANYDLGILNFVPPADGRYTLRLEALALGDYGLVVTQNTVFESENNNTSVEPLRLLGDALSGIGYLNIQDTPADPGNADTFEVDLLANQAVEVRTFTPFSDPATVPHDLDPVISVFTSTGALLATDDNSAPDGKNALATFFAPTAGRYQIRVSAAAGEGEYEVIATPIPKELSVALNTNFVSEADGIAAAQLTITRNSNPDVALTVSLSSDDTSEIAVPSPVLFQPGDTSVTVDIEAVQDLLLDGIQTATISVQGLAHTSAQIDISVTDDDLAAFSADVLDNVIVSEDGTVDQVSLVLDVGPPTDVVLQVSSDDTTETSSNGTVTFTAANWNVPQLVDVSGIDDNVLDGDVVSSLTVSVVDALSDPLFATVPDQQFNATTLDNDVPSIVVTPPVDGMIVSENGTPANMDISLGAEPVGDVVLAITLADPTDTTEVDVLTSSLTFTPANWSDPQTVTVLGLDDLVVDGDQVTVVNIDVDPLNSHPAFSALATTPVDVTTTDNEQGDFIVSNSAALTASEDGATDSFSVRLNAQPLTNVRITAFSDNLGEVTTTPTSLLFTPANWDQPQDVVVAAVDDAVVDGSQTVDVRINVDAFASDQHFAGVAEQVVSVETTDNDVAGLTLISSGPLSVDESGTIASFGVVLTGQPFSPVVFDVTSNDETEASVSGQLTFLPVNWNIPQQVVVTGVDDFEPDGTQTSIISVNPDLEQTTGAFATLGPRALPVTTTDDEPGRLDVDDNGAANAATDGILIVRHLLGFTGEALIDNAVGQNANRQTGFDVTTTLDGSPGLLDADGDGDLEAATDGILIVRYLLGFTGNTLVNNAIGINATRRTGAEVSAYLDLFHPANASPILDDGANIGAVTTGGDVEINFQAPDALTSIFRWNEIENADEYRIRIQNLSTGNLLNDQTTPFGSFKTGSLSHGVYRVWVEAINTDSASTLSSGWLEFAITEVDNDADDDDDVALGQLFQWQFVDVHANESAVSEEAAVPQSKDSDSTPNEEAIDEVMSLAGAWLDETEMAPLEELAAVN